MQYKHTLLIAAGLVAATANPVQAGSLRFTIEAPGVQTSRVTVHTLTTETFDAFSLGAQTLPVTGAVGDYSGGYLAIGDQDVFGGAGAPASGSPQYAETDSNYTLTFGSAVGYFGFWWSAGDGNNELVVDMADGSSQTFTTQSIIDSPNLQGSPNPDYFAASTDGHYGNPNGPLSDGSNDVYLPGEAFAFVNIYALTDQSKMTSIQFRESAGGLGFFETDNHTISTDLILADNQTGADVPVPAPLALMLAGLAGIGAVRLGRKRGKERIALG
jgi:hypothetical protein